MPLLMHNHQMPNNYRSFDSDFCKIRFRSCTSLQGFTLIELLVAMSIFAFVSVITFQAIDSALRTREVITQSREREAEVEKAIAILMDDLMQLAPRPVRDQSANLLPAYSYNETTSRFSDNQTYPLAFTRAGVPQVGLIYEHGLQRIAYDYNEQTQQLIRIVWPVLDIHSFSEPKIYPILSNVESVSFRQIDEQFKEHNTWPPSLFTADKERGEQAVNPLIHLPFAIKFKITLKDMGVVERVIPGVSFPLKEK